MRGDSESRSRYLFLALTSRRAIDSLRAVAGGHPLDQSLGDSLTRLLAGIGQEANANFVSHLQERGSWTYFEELSTIDELKRETRCDDLGEVVSSILRDPETDARRQNAKRLITFLTAVEGRALQRYTEAMELQIA